MTRLMLACVLALAACQTAPPPMQTAGDWWRAYELHPQTVRLADGRRMNYLCTGAGSPTVLFEGGLGSAAFSWRNIQPAISQTTRACSYDRAGLGASDPGPGPRDTNALTNDIEALLKAANITGPLVLVGHSMGSYSVQMFAYRHPDRVAGIVLVDPSSDNQTQRFTAAAPALQKLQDDAMDPPKACIAALGSGPLKPDTDLYKSCIGAPPPDMPADLHSYHVAYGQSAAHYRTRLAENDSFEHDSAELLAARRPLAMPLIVLTAENTTNLPGLDAATRSAAAQVWLDMHLALARLSTKGEHRFIRNSGHSIQTDQPAAVITAIEDVLAAARKR